MIACDQKWKRSRFAKFRGFHRLCETIIQKNHHCEATKHVDWFLQVFSDTWYNVFNLLMRLTPAGILIPDWSPGDCLRHEFNTEIHRDSKRNVNI